MQDMEEYVLQRFIIRSLNYMSKLINWQMNLYYWYIWKVYVRNNLYNVFVIDISGIHFEIIVS